MPNDAPRKRRLWDAIERKRLSFEDAQTRNIHDALLDAITPILANIRTFGIQDTLRDPHVNKTAIEDAYIDLYQTVGVAFANEQYHALQEKSLKQDEPLEDMWMDEMLNFARNEAGERIVAVAQQTQTKIRNVLEKAVQEGWGIEKTARQMQSSSWVSRNRARRIARTEIVSASNRGSMMGARSTRLDLQKEWISTQDGRTRDGTRSGFDHVEADGEVVDQNEPFVKTGEDLDYPGDPSGSVANVINCRCTVAHITYD